MTAKEGKFMQTFKRMPRWLRVLVVIVLLIIALAVVYFVFSLVAIHGPITGHHHRFQS